MRIYSISGIKSMLKILKENDVELADEELFSEENFNVLSEKEIDSFGESLFEFIRPLCIDLLFADISWEDFRDTMRLVERYENRKNQILKSEYGSEQYKEDFREFNSIGQRIVDKMFQDTMNLPSYGDESDIDWWIHEAKFGANKDVIGIIDDKNFPEDSEFHRPILDSLNNFYRYLCATSYYIKIVGPENYIL